MTNTVTKHLPGVDVHLDPDTMRIHFRAFHLDAYQVFLAAKRIPESVTVFHPEDETYSITAPSRFASLLGADLEVPRRAELPFSPFLFDDQVEIARMALAAKRFAVWSDCGLGKTLIAAEFARHVIHRTGGRVLIVTVNEVVNQFVDEIRHYHGDALPVVRLYTRKEMREWCGAGTAGGPGLAVTNYEKLNPDKGKVENQLIDEFRCLKGIILDESNRLAQGGGKQKWAVIKSSRGVEYKMSCTATPAPNDTMEFASQASFLEKMRSDGEIIWTYFVRDSKTHRWTVKKHARKAFFEFMSSWSICVRDPRKYGWRLNHPDVPEPTILTHEIPATERQREILYELSADQSTGQRSLLDEDTNAIQRSKLSQVAKGFRYLKGESGRKVELVPSHKPAKVAELVCEEVAAGLQVLVWTVFDAETNILAELLRKLGVEFGVITGKTKEFDRIGTLESFRKGTLPVLVSRASMLGMGLNFQNCGSMIFSGFNDSFVQFYQAVRRAYRYGQKRSVRVHVPVVPELEQDMWENVCRKDRRHEEEAEEMEMNYIRTRKEIWRGLAN